MNSLKILAASVILFVFFGCSEGGASFDSTSRVSPSLVETVLSVDENAVAGTLVGNLTIAAAGDSNITSIDLNGTGAGNFTVSAAGAISVASAAALDYEAATVYNLSARAVNDAGASGYVGVTIHVNDISDVLPALSNTTLTVNENAVVGTAVGNVAVAMVGDSAITSIDLNGTGNENFTVSPAGAITVASGALLDFESAMVYNLSARALNSAGPSGYVNVTITVNDVADIVPMLVGATLGVNENVAAGTPVGNITIISAGDSAVSAIDLNGTDAGNFAVSPSGAITVAPGASLDYETTTFYSLSARALNGAGSSGYVNVTINVNDNDDIVPVLSGATLSIDENTAAGATIGNITITTVGDSNITAIDLNGTGAANFTVSTVGEVTVAGGAGLDFETDTVYNLSARAQNGAGWSDYVAVTINVNDIADVIPVLTDATLSVDEDAADGSAVGNIAITTAGDSAITAIDLNGTGAANFTVSTAGAVTVAGGASLDYETTTEYNLSARAQNGAGWSDYVSVTVNVNDVADVVPVFSDATLSVDENATLGTTVGNITITTVGDSAITAIDLNGTGAANFTVSTAGEVTVAIGANLDYETTTVYSLSARAQNSAGWSGYISVTVNVNDIADVVPVLSNAVLNIDEDALVGAPVGNITITTAGDSAITAIDLNGTGAANFTVSTAGAVTVAGGASFDYETTTEYNLSARAQNGSGWSDYVNVTISVNNTADIVPVLADAALSVDENSVVGGLVGNITITSAGDSAITSIDLNGTGAENFTVATDGVVTVASGGWLDYETTTEYNLSARAQNGAGWSDYVSLNVNVNDLAESPQTMPLVLIAIRFNDYLITDSDLNWHDKIFGTADGQLNHYYDQVSGGNFALLEANETDGTVDDGIINVALGIDHPGDILTFRNHLVTAVNLANPFIDFSAYDSDFNGAISTDELQIMFIVAGGETSAGDPVANSIWAHAWSLSLGPSAPTVDGVKVMDYFTGGNYSRFGEKHGTNVATIGIIAHELGHAMFNLPDLYDIDDSSAGIGNFALMASGSWGYKVSEDPGATPVHMCAWSKLEQGWVTPEVINVTTNNLSMTATHTGHGNIVKVPTADPEEYFLIENRSPLGYDAGMYILDGVDFDGGLALWHIDEGQRNAGNTDNSDESHKLVDLEEANDPELDSSPVTRGTRTNLYYGGNSTLFDDTSTPNSKLYNATATNISVNNISVIGGAGEEYKITIDISR